MLNTKSFALAAGITWGLGVFLMGLIGATGFGIGFVNGLGTMYLGYQAGIVGAIIGFIYGLIDGFIGGFIFAFLYNLFEAKMK